MSSSDNHGDSFKDLIGALAKLPGVGPKTAQRYAFYLLHGDRSIAQDLSDAIIDALTKISNCHKCNTLCEGRVCKICISDKQLRSKIG